MSRVPYVILLVTQINPVDLVPVEYNGETVLLEDEAHEAFDKLAEMYPDKEYVLVPLKTNLVI